MAGISGSEQVAFGVEQSRSSGPLRHGRCCGGLLGSECVAIAHAASRRRRRSLAQLSAGDGVDDPVASRASSGGLHRAITNWAISATKSTST